MGNYFLRIDTKRFNTAVKSFDVENSAYPEKIILLNAVGDDAGIADLIQNCYENAAHPDDAKLKLLEQLRERFFAEFDLAQRYTHLNSEQLASKEKLENKNLTEFIEQLKSDRLIIPSNVENLRTYILALNNTDSSQDQIYQCYQQCFSGQVLARQQMTQRDLPRGFHLQNEKITKLSDLEQLELAPKLINYIKEYLNQDYLSNIGADLLARELGALVNISPGSYYTNIVPLADGCRVDTFLTYKAFSPITSQTEIENGNIKALGFVSLEIKDTDPNSSKIYTIENNLVEAAVEVCDHRLNSILQTQIDQTVIIQKLLTKQPLLAIEQNWMTEKARTFTSYQALPFEILIWACSQPNADVADIINNWLKANNQINFSKLPLAYLAWLYMHAPDTVHETFNQHFVNLRLLLEDEAKYSSVINGTPQPILTLWQEQSAQLESVINNRKTLRLWLREDHSKLPIFNILMQYVRLGIRDGGKQWQALGMVQSMPLLRSLTTAQFVELATCGNLDITKLMIAPWSNQFLNRWQRIWFDWQHPMHHLNNAEIAQIFLANADWCASDACPLFVKQSWLRESWLGRLFFGAPLRYRLSEQDYQAILNQLSVDRRATVIAKMTNDVKLKTFIEKIASNDESIKQNYYQVTRNRPYTLAEIYTDQGANEQIYAQDTTQHLTDYLQKLSPGVQLKEFEESPWLVNYALDVWTNLLTTRHTSRVLKLCRQQPSLLEKTAQAFILKPSVRKICYEKPALLHEIYSYLMNKRSVLLPAFYDFLKNDKNLQNNTKFSHSKLMKMIGRNNIIPVDGRDLPGFQDWLSRDGRDSSKLAHNVMHSLLEVGQETDFILAFYDKPDLVEQAIATQSNWKNCECKTLPIQLANLYLRTKTAADLAALCLANSNFFNALPEVEQVKIKSSLKTQDVKDQFNKIISHPGEVKSFIASPLLVIELFVDAAPENILQLIINETTGELGRAILNVYSSNFCLKNFIETSPQLFAKLFTLADPATRSKMLKANDILLREVVLDLQLQYHINLFKDVEVKDFLDRNLDIKQLLANDARSLSPVPSVGASPLSVSPEASSSSESSESSDSSDSENVNKPKYVEVTIPEQPSHTPEELSDDEKPGAAFIMDHLFEKRRSTEPDQPYNSIVAPAELPKEALIH